MIVVGILIALLIAVTGGICGNLFNSINHVSRVVMGRIDNRVNFYFSSATTRFSYFGIFWGNFVVCSRGYQVDVRMWLIKINLDRKKSRFLPTRASTTKFAPRLNPPIQKTSTLRVN